MILKICHKNAQRNGQDTIKKSFLLFEGVYMAFQVNCFLSNLLVIKTAVKLSGLRHCRFLFGFWCPYASVVDVGPVVQMFRVEEGLNVFYSENHQSLLGNLF